MNVGVGPGGLANGNYDGPANWIRYAAGRQENETYEADSQKSRGRTAEVSAEHGSSLAGVDATRPLFVQCFECLFRILGR